VGNNPGDETSRQHVSNRQADSIDGDRTFDGDVARESGWQFDFETVIGALFCKIDNVSGAIDVALHEVSTEAVSRAEGALKIDATIRAKLPQIRSLERFIQKIKCKLSILAAGESQTATIYRDAGAEPGLGGQNWRGNLQFATGFARAQSHHRGDFFNEPGEHSDTVESRRAMSTIECGNLTTAGRVLTRT
jgi:hypothetical protein